MRYAPDFRIRNLYVQRTDSRFRSLGAKEPTFGSVTTANNIWGIRVSVRVSVNYFKRDSFSTLDLALRVGLLLPVLASLVAKSRLALGLGLGTSRGHISAPRCSTIIFTNS